MSVAGIQDQIKLVSINLQNRPAWYKEKVYPDNKALALEHNGKIIGDSLDVIKYVDSNFEGPSLFPNDPHKVKFGEELISHVGTVTGALYTTFKADDTVKQAGNSFYRSYTKKSTSFCCYGTKDPEDKRRIKITEEKCNIKCFRRTTDGQTYPDISSLLQPTDLSFSLSKSKSKEEKEEEKEEQFNSKSTCFREQ